MPAISALVHTRNEAAVLGPCLESLRWVDELIVADMGSTDATREIAAAAGARVIDVPVVPLVDTVRNLAVGQCAGPWVLVVDADERVPPTLAARLREIAAGPTATAADAYALPRQNRFLGVWLEHGFWPDPQVRFFRQEAARWTDHVHEPPRVTGRLEELPAEPAFALDHPGYASGPRTVRGKAGPVCPDGCPPAARGGEPGRVPVAPAPTVERILQPIFPRWRVASRRARAGVERIAGRLPVPRRRPPVGAAGSG